MPILARGAKCSLIHAVNLFIYAHVSFILSGGLRTIETYKLIFFISIY